MTDAEALILGEAEPENVTRVTTPSGLEIAYCPEPRYYEIDGSRVPSVTTVLNVLRKDALTWWGMRMGVQGLLDLQDQPELSWMALGMADEEEIVSLLKQYKLTTIHRRDQASDRGTSVHNALERWFHTGNLPEAEGFPDEEAGYVRGVRAFLEAVRPEPLEAELMVGSAEHGFAGRFDLFARTDKVVVQVGPRTKRTVPRGKGIWDLKSRKRDSRGRINIYPENELQVAGYKRGAEECGYERSDYEAIVAVSEDGGFNIKISRAYPDDFLAVLWAHRACEALGRRK